jgi:hypothetical protein
MQRLRKPVETPRSVMQQKPGVVCSQNYRRLGIPAMRFNHVNGDLLAQQNPQILRPCSERTRFTENGATNTTSFVTGRRR